MLIATLTAYHKTINMETNEKLLKDYTDREKGAYLGAIASIATADRAASEDELDYITELADSADISDDQKQAVIRAATELSGEELTRCLDILKTSDLRFSLITDLMNFAKSDAEYSEEEQKNVEKIAGYLNINREQFSLLDQFVDKTAESEVEPEEVSKPGFLSSLGLEDKFKKAGIDWKTVGKGLLTVAGPMILANMLTGRRGSSMGTGSRSMLGGIGGVGIGSLIGMLSGGRGYANSGGLLSKVLRGFR